MMILLAILAAIALAFIITKATWKNVEGKIYARGVQPTMFEFGCVWLLFPILVIVIAIVLVIILSIKLIELLDNQSDQEFSKTFSNYAGLSPTNYFRQFLACLALFGWLSGKRGFCSFSRLPNIDDQLQETGITSENLKLFIQQNSAPHSAQTDTSFRGKITKTLDSVPEYYQPLFYNQFLETPFVECKDQEFCLPDPFSFTESCWNQVRRLVSKDDYGKKLGQLLSSAFEDYLENVLLPFVCPSSFERIPEVNNPNSSKDKRADFLVETQKAYILIECKSCVMHSDTSAYFQADKLADLWCRVHSALEQIARTVEAFNLHDKPVIPLILTFYDSIAASTVFEEIVKQTNYCSIMKLNMPPIVYSLHEFEHWISDRSIYNWSELILAKQNTNSPVKPDHKGHDYGHLSDVSIL